MTSLVNIESLREFLDLTKIHVNHFICKEIEDDY